MNIQELKEVYERKPPIGQNFFELLWLIEHLKNCIPLRRVLEIGCLYGGTLKIWDAIVESNTNSLIVSVDTRIELCEYKSDRTILIKGRSDDNDVINKIKEYAPFDFIFIDGLHYITYTDFINYFPMLRIQGMLAIHDIDTTDFWCRLRIREKRSIERREAHKCQKGVGLIIKEKAEFSFAPPRKNGVLTNKFLDEY